MDHDRVEPHNLRRQNFFPGDVGKFKSQALAERLSSMYGRRIGYSVLPYDRDLLNDEALGGMGRAMRSGIIIGCVDRAASRRSIASELDWGDWWIDAGNGFQSGQVLIGNVTDREMMKECFEEETELVTRLPAPSLQLPGLLIPGPWEAEQQRDCAEEVQAEEQSPVINQAMASLVLEFMSKLIRGELTWMGAYLDLEAGTLSTVPAEPETVARMLGVKVDTLMVQGCHIGRLSRPIPRRGGGL